MDEQEREVSSGGGDRFLPISIIVAGIMISGSVLYAINRAPSSSLPKSPAPVAGPGVATDYLATISEVHDRDVILGDSKAPVTLVEYGDYQCPFCGRFFTQTEPKIRDVYIKTGKVQMIYRNLAFLGPESQEAAEAAECAKDQKKFWPYHDEIFNVEVEDGEEHNGNLNRDLFLKIARDLGMDAAAFTACYDGNKYAEKVKKETADAQAAGVNATPTNFVNGELVRGAQPFEQFKEVIDASIRTQRQP